MTTLHYSDLPPLPPLDFERGGAGHPPGHDALALARLAPLAPGIRVLDLGAGQAVVAIAIAARETLSVVGCEIQPAPLQTARRNIERNRPLLRGRIQLIRADLRRPPWRTAAFQLVLINPPYHRPGSGRISPRPDRAAARHALHGDFPHWAAAAAHALPPGGILAAITRPDRADELARALETHGFAPPRQTHLRIAHATNPKIVFIESRKN